MQNAIIIFIRNPELGKVKTRLAATIGNEKTLEIYKQLLQHTYEVVDEIYADKFVFYTDAVNENDIWNDYYKLVQADGALGQRMQHAFEFVFKLGYNNVCIIGSDCYDLNIDILRQAFTALKTNDVAIGPANDGGYYLLGLKEMKPALFLNKNWSTETVFTDTVLDCQNDKISYTTLPVLIDIDELSDLKQTALWVAT